MLYDILVITVIILAVIKTIDIIHGIVYRQKTMKYLETYKEEEN
jgi:hypothetical protein